MNSSHKEHDMIFRGFLVLLLLIAILGVTGCESLNNDPNNKRYWFPSLTAPGHLNSDHEYWSGEISDPYLDPTIGPRSLQDRPKGFEVPRSRTTQVLQNKSAQVTAH